MGDFIWEGGGFFLGNGGGGGVGGGAWVFPGGGGPKAVGGRALGGRARRGGGGCGPCGGAGGSWWWPPMARGPSKSPQPWSFRWSQNAACARLAATQSMSRGRGPQSLSAITWSVVHGQMPRH